MRFFSPLVLSVAVAVPAVADDPDESAVKAAGLSADGPALLDFVRQRSRETADRDELASFVTDLGSADPKAAGAAQAALVARGPLAVPALRRAANDLADRAKADRARKALGLVEGRAGADLAAAVARLLGAKNPGGAVEALLDYLPYADDANVLDAVGGALAQLAYPEGKAHPALLKAIDSDLPILRATAVEALSKPDH